MQAEILEQSLVIPPEVRRGVRRRRWVTLAVLGAVAVGGTLVLVARNRPQPIQYRTTSVERRTVVRMVEATGHLDVTTRVEVALPEQGAAKLLVQPGDNVKAGQPLAQLDARAAQIALRGAQATLAAAGSRVAEAQTALAAATESRERTERLVEKQLASATDLVAAKSAESKAKAALATARAERSATTPGLQSAELSQTQTTLSSPIDGVVLQAPSSQASSGPAEKHGGIVVGSALETLRVDADVAESEVGQLHPGQVAHFSVPAFPGRTFDGKVVRIGIDAQRGAAAVRYPVELSADNPGRALLPGMTATVTIEVDRAENALAVREAALRFRPEGAGEVAPRRRVWSVTPGGLDAVAVKPGLSDGAFTVVESEPASALPVGTRLALGVLNPEPSKSSGPGIKLGR